MANVESNNLTLISDNLESRIQVQLSKLHIYKIRYVSK